MQRHLTDALKERRALAPQIEKAEALLESLNNAHEDNESVIADLQSCIKGK